MLEDPADVLLEGPNVPEVPGVVTTVDPRPAGRAFVEPDAPPQADATIETVITATSARPGQDATTSFADLPLLITGSRLRIPVMPLLYARPVPPDFGRDQKGAVTHPSSAGPGRSRPP